MTAEIVYEHPLNEKVRAYLRIEHLFAQLNSLKVQQDNSLQLSFFSTLFTLIDVLERSDVRPDLIKDLERCESQLVLWSNHPSVSDKKLQLMLQQALRLQSELLRSGKLVNQLKEDKFLTPLRQRFAMPGGCCYFDMPQLQFWLSFPAQEQLQKKTSWLEQLQLTEQAIDFVLGFYRERGQFSEVEASNGFYQKNTEQFELLRIKYSQSGCSFPTVSGNKHRYAIRFMQLCEHNGRSACTEAIRFELAQC